MIDALQPLLAREVEKQEKKANSSLRKMGSSLKVMSRWYHLQGGAAAAAAQGFFTLSTRQEC